MGNWIISKAPDHTSKGKRTYYIETVGDNNHIFGDKTEAATFTDEQEALDLIHIAPLYNCRLQKIK